VGFADTQTSMLPGKPGSAMCVQNFNDSRGLAIRITYRISLRSSSLWEPRHPLLKVVSVIFLRLHRVTKGRRQTCLGFQIGPVSSGLLVKPTGFSNCGAAAVSHQC
jgi:hypothetical protein